MPNPFFDVLASIGRPGSLGNSLFSIPQTLERNAGVARFQDAMKKNLEQGLPMQAAMLQVFQQDPSLLSELPDDVMSNAQNLIQLATAAMPNAANPKLENVTMDGQTVARNINDPNVIAEIEQGGGVIAGAVNPDTILQRIKEYEKEYGPLTDEQRLNMINAIQAAGTNVTINPSAPDLSPIFNFLDKEHKTEILKRVDKINLAVDNLDQLIKLADNPNAALLMGPGGTVSNLLAPLSSMAGFDTALGPLGGPDIKTLGDAQSKMRQVIVDSAQAVLDTGGRGMSDKDMNMAREIVNSPDKFWTSPQQVKGAAESVLGSLVKIQRQNKADLEQGGVSPTPRSLGEGSGGVGTRSDGSPAGTAGKLQDLTPAQQKQLLDLAAKKLREMGIKEGEASDADNQKAITKALEELKF